MGGGAFRREGEDVESKKKAKRGVGKNLPPPTPIHWETFSDGSSRVEVPGGWIYRVPVGALYTLPVFVPSR